MSFALALGVASIDLVAQSATSVEELARARQQLLAAMPAAEVEQASEAGRAVEARRLRTALARLVPVEVAFTIRGVVRRAGLSLRAWHRRLDLSAGPVRVDGQGGAVVRLPRGEWIVDVWDPEPRAGRAVFGRAVLTVDGAGPRDLRLDATALVTFRARTGRSRTPESVVLTPPDVAVVVPATTSGGRLEVAMTQATRATLLAARGMGDEDGFIARVELTPGRRDVRVEGKRATEFVFDTKAPRELVARFLGTDAVPLNLLTSTTRKRSMWLSGMSEIALGFDLKLGPGKKVDTASFYRRPFVLDGTRRTFTGRPPFVLSVGHRVNSGRFFTKRFARSFRVFVREQNGMVLRGWSKNPYRVDWAMLRDGKERGSGTLQSDLRGLVTRNRLAGDGPFRYRLRLHGPGVDRREVLTANDQSETVTVGRTKVHCYTEFRPNAELFARWCNRHVQAFDETNAVRPPDVHVRWWTHQARGILGMGSWRNVWLTENKLAGFTGPHYWHWNVTHELAHAFGYNVHGKSHQAAMQRAAVRFRSLDSGPDRVPAGDRFREVLEAIARGEVEVSRPAAAPTDAVPAGAAAGSYETTAPKEPVESPALADGFTEWFVRQQFGVESDKHRRTWSAAWRWWLTLRGFSNAECDAAAWSFGAGENLAWLARLRGRDVRDARIDRAIAELGEAKGRFVRSQARARVRKRWRAFKPASKTDLAARAASAFAELGDRELRVTALLALARESQRRREPPARTRDRLVAALVEARLAASNTFETALGEAVTIWAQQSR
ncbi:MAG: hypothetical protein NXI31_15800 [bacterium]|nr:hypothetical protein [bacterium]